VDDARQPDTGTELAVSVLSETLESVVEEATKAAAPVLLLHVVSAAIAGPAAAVLGTAAKALIGELLKQTSASARQIERIIEEPLRTATAVVDRVLTAQLSEPDEFREADRQLKVAYDTLQTALSYTPDKRLLIGFYQALVAALMVGGRGFATGHVTELRALAARYRAGSTAAADRAREIRQDLERSIESFQSGIVHAPGVGVERVLQQLAISLPRARQEGARDALEKEAAALLGRAERIDRFCDFVTALAQHQEDVLRSATN
jgi:hypothetical protein